MMPKVGFVQVYSPRGLRDPSRDHLRSERCWERGEGRQQGQGRGTKGRAKAAGRYLTPGKCFSFCSPKPECEHSPPGRVRAPRQVPGAEQRGDGVRAVENSTWLLTGGQGAAEPPQPLTPGRGAKTPGCSSTRQTGVLERYFQSGGNYLED